MLHPVYVIHTVFINIRKNISNYVISYYKLEQKYFCLCLLLFKPRCFDVSNV